MIRVLSVGPTPDQPGGMAAVVSELANQSRRFPGSVDMSIADSGGIGANMLFRALAFVKCAVRILYLRPAIVHLHVASRGSTWRKLILSIVCRAARLRYGIHLHGASYADFLTHQSRASLVTIRSFFRHAQFTVVLGETWASFVVDEIGLSREKVHVIYNGVAGSLVEQVTKGAMPSPDRYALFLGRFERLKGVHDLLDAWDVSVGPDERLLMAGSETDPDVVSLARRYSERTDSAVRYLGLVSRERSLDLLRGAWIVILPSYAEGLPMALIEAMSMGVPCIATPVGAIPELIQDGENGWIVPPGDTAALSAAIRTAFLEPDVRNERGRAAFRTWEARFDSQVMFNELCGVWETSARK